MEAYNSFSIPIFILKKGCFSWVNPPFQRLLSIGSSQHIIGLPFISLVHPEDRVSPVLNAIQTAEIPEACPLSLRLSNGDGRYQWVRGSVEPMQVEGEILIWGSVMDPYAHPLVKKFNFEAADRMRLILDEMEDGYTEIEG